MKMTLPLIEFKSLIGSVLPAIPRKHPREIYTAVRVEADGQNLTVSGTDGDIYVRSRMACEAEGQWCVSVTMLYKLLGTLDGDEVTLETDKAGSKIRVRSGRADFRLQCFDAAEYPAWQGYEGEYATVEAQTKSLLLGLSRVSFATDAESTRYALGSVQFATGGASATVAATDSRRLAVADIKLTDDLHHPILVPKAACDLVAKGLVGRGDDVKMHYTKHWVGFEADGFELFGRQQEGRFPRWQDVVPKRKESRVLPLTVGQLHNKVNQASILTAEESRGVDFEFGDGVLTMRTSTADVGQSKVELVIGESEIRETVSLDPRYLQPMLAILDPEELVEVQITDGESAVRWDVDGYTYVMMPLAKE